MTVKGSTKDHHQLVDDILITFGSQPGVRLWRNNTGAGRAMDSNAVIRFGLPGSSDIIGLTSTGRFVAIEVKTGAAKLRKNQQAFKAMMLKYNAIYIEARDLADVAKQFNF